MLDQSSPYNIDNMTESTKANWFALANGLKFIDVHSKNKNATVDENDIDTRALISYIDSVSGDIQYNLKHKGGIPFKYSLDPSHDESKNIEEIVYVP